MAAELVLQDKNRTCAEINYGRLVAWRMLSVYVRGDTHGLK